MGDPLGVDLPTGPTPGQMPGDCGTSGLSHQLIQRAPPPAATPAPHAWALELVAVGAGSDPGSRIRNPASGIREYQW